MFSIADAKHAVQLFQGEALGLREQEVGVHGGEDVPAGVPGECTLGGECAHESRPGQRDDEVETPAGCGGHGHAEIADVERE